MLKLLFMCLSLFSFVYSRTCLMKVSVSLMFLSLCWHSNYGSYIVAGDTFTLQSLGTPLITLTVWLSALMLIASSNIFLAHDRSHAFYFYILILTVILIFAFSSNNLLGFYMFFEASLVPTLILILGWGYQPERLSAGIYLMLYTISASLPLMMNIGHLYFFKATHFLDLGQFGVNKMSFGLLWGMTFVLAFLVKMPMYFTHLWLPKAHVEAPVAGSMVLAGVLLKLGGYGLLRLLGYLPNLMGVLSPMLLSLSLIGASLTSLICLRQTDMKSLIAYSSVGHMALLIAASMTFSTWGWEGSLLLMLAHGLCSSGLFFMAFTIYQTSQTRSLFLTKGLLNYFPAMSLLWFLFVAFNMAAPPTINLASEIIMLASVLMFSWTSFMFLMLIGFLSAAYSLVLYTATNHGQSGVFTSPLNYFNNLNFLVALLHLVPALVLIFAPSFILIWT